jgi:hypothetical protein
MNQAGVRELDIVVPVFVKHSLYADRVAGKLKRNLERSRSDVL